jgi:hypothetical protein
VPIQVSGGRTLTVRNSATFLNTVTLGSAADGTTGDLRYENNTTIYGSGPVVFEGGGGRILNANSLRHLTLDNLTVRAAAGAAGGIVADTVVNGGLLGASGAGSSLGVFGALLNVGELSATDGGRLNIANLQGAVGANVTLAGAGSLLELGGTYTIDQPLVVPAGATLRLGGNVHRTADLNVNGTLIVDYAAVQPSPLAEWVADVTSGYAGGAWTGPGVRSSAAAADSTLALGIAEAAAVAPGGSFNGVPVDATALILHLTLVGDANLDRTVNLADFNALAAHFGRTPRTFFQGDFNYDGVVNLDDFNSLAARFGETF